KSHRPTTRRLRLMPTGKRHGLQKARMSAKNAGDEEKEGCLLDECSKQSEKAAHSPPPPFCRLTVQERESPVNPSSVAGLAFPFPAPCLAFFTSLDDDQRLFDHFGSGGKAKRRLNQPGDRIVKTTDAASDCK